MSSWKGCCKDRVRQHVWESQLRSRQRINAKSLPLPSICWVLPDANSDVNETNPRALRTVENQRTRRGCRKWGYRVWMRLWRSTEQGAPQLWPSHDQVSRVTPWLV